MNNIKLTQIPVIVYDQLQAEGNTISERIDKLGLDKIVVNEETVKDFKKLRSDLKKEFDDYEVSRKMIKEGINNPYKEFENAYKEHISDKYKQADLLLKNSIDETQDRMKNQTLEVIRKYFNEINEYKFVKFEQIGIVVKLSDAEKKLKEQVDTFLSKVKEDLSIIDSQQHKDRIKAKYVRNLDLTSAITQTIQEVEYEENEKARKLEVKEEVTIEREVIKPIKKEVHDSDFDDEFTVQFKATSTKAKLIKLKEFMKVEGIKYE